MLIKYLQLNHPDLYVNDFWIFGYASLMWNPGFLYGDVCHARIYGYHRALCVRSWVHRGTRQNPGLVFGLDVGGSCIGLVYRVARQHVKQVLEYLMKRELPTGIYVPRVLDIHTMGRKRKGVAFVVCRDHEQYVGNLSVEREAEIIHAGHGPSGGNRDYVLNTLLELERLGVRNRRLDRLKSLLAGVDGSRSDA